MKKAILLVMLCFAFAANAQQAEIRRSVEVFFEGLNSKDTAKIQSVCSRGMVLQSVNEGPKGGELSTITADDFFGSIASIPPALSIEERIVSYDIKVDGSMAHVWAPYEFYTDGKLSHRGVDSFQMFKDNGTWKIVYIIDTRRK
jgi:hypothetical protein